MILEDTGKIFRILNGVWCDGNVLNIISKIIFKGCVSVNRDSFSISELYAVKIK